MNELAGVIGIDSHARSHQEPKRDEDDGTDEGISNHKRTGELSTLRTRRLGLIYTLADYRVD